MRAQEVGEMISQLSADKGRPMTADESFILITLMTASQETVSKMAVDMDDMPLYRILSSRADVSCSKPVDFRLKAFAACLCENPAEAVMFGAVFEHLATNYPEDYADEPMVTLQQFCDIFPMKIPNKEVLREAWTAQKKSVEERGPFADNWLDDARAWNRIMQEERA